MIRYFIVLLVLTLAPGGIFLVWLNTLPTEEQLVTGHAPQLESKLKQLKHISTLLPPVGSVTKNELPARLDPLPVCDFQSRQCNLQFIDAPIPISLQKPQAFLTGHARPDNFASVLRHSLQRSQQPNSHTPKVWGYQKVFQDTLEARYLIVNQYITRRTPQGTETVLVEGFLFDLDTTQMLGSFTYPNVDFRARFQFLAGHWGTQINPEIPIRANLLSGDVETVKFYIAFWSIAMGVVLFFSLLTATSVAKEPGQLAELKKRGIYPETLSCPRCGQSSESLKQIRLPRFLLFLIIFMTVRMETVTACPPCMRRTILWRFLGNLLPGNLVMFFMAPGFLFHFVRTFQHDHTPGAVTCQLGDGPK